MVVWEEVKEQPIDVQINILKDEIRQGDEVVKKLKVQKEKLLSEVKEIGEIVNAEVQKEKEEEKKRIELSKKLLKNKDQLEIVMPKLSDKQVQERVHELEKELENTRKQAKILA